MTSYRNKTVFYSLNSVSRVPQGSINSIIMESHYIRVYHFSSDSRRHYSK